MSVVLGLLLELKRLLLLLWLLHLRGGLTGRVCGEVSWELVLGILRMDRHRMWLASCTRSVATTLTTSPCSLPLASWLLLVASGPSAPTATAASATLLLFAPSVPSPWLFLTVKVGLIFATFLVHFILGLLRVHIVSGSILVGSEVEILSVLWIVLSIMVPHVIIESQVEFIKFRLILFLTTRLLFLLIFVLRLVPVRVLLILLIIVITLAVRVVIVIHTVVIILIIIDIFIIIVIISIKPMISAIIESVRGESSVVAIPIVVQIVH